MRDPENIRDVATVLPDYMGFIFYKESPRNVTTNFTVPVNIPSSIKKVGVFVNDTPASIIEIVQQHNLDFAQLHGNESVIDCEVLKTKGIKLIKVFSVHDEFNFNAVKPYQSIVDYFLFDTKGKHYGGNNQSFNWSLLRNYNQQIPFFLSGGLSIGNLSNLNSIVDLNIHALDLNSGVEVSPGFKSVLKIRSVQNLLNDDSQLLSINS